MRGFGRRIRRELSGGKAVVPADNEARRDLVWRGAARLARGDGWADDEVDALLAAKRRSGIGGN